MKEGLFAMWAQRTPAEAHAILASPDVSVTNQSDKEVQLPKLMTLDELVRKAFIARDGTNRPSPQQPILMHGDSAMGITVPVTVSQPSGALLDGDGTVMIPQSMSPQLGVWGGMPPQRRPLSGALFLPRTGGGTSSCAPELPFLVALRTNLSVPRFVAPEYTRPGRTLRDTRFLAAKRFAELIEAETSKEGSEPSTPH